MSPSHLSLEQEPMGTVCLDANREQLTDIQVAQYVVQEVIRKGVREFCISTGSRNAPLIYTLAQLKHIKLYYWPEERSAAFFALGRIKATGRPVAVVTTSGTAAGELLPATMEAYYNSLPLVLITADRPRRLRGTGAPQTAEQVGLFGCYAHFSQDIEREFCQLEEWHCKGPAHINVCFESVKEVDCQKACLDIQPNMYVPPRYTLRKGDIEYFHEFMDKSAYPLVVVGAMPSHYCELAVQFLLALQAPVYAEGLSGLREEPRLAHLRIKRIDRIWHIAEQAGYPLDGVLRLGGMPTARLWRDLEESKNNIQICSISEQPFSGSSRAGVIHTSLSMFFTQVEPTSRDLNVIAPWMRADLASQHALLNLFKEEPLAEPSFFHFLSEHIPKKARLYLGNSMPIREWDLAASYEEKGYIMGANRGVNGIDGQLSTFFGFSMPEQENWAIFGDLTTLYDMVAPWILPQLADRHVTIVIVNNGGGQIFSRLYSLPGYSNPHHWQFDAFAAFWKLKYERWEHIPSVVEPSSVNRLIEVIPDAAATHRFWSKLAQ